MSVAYGGRIPPPSPSQRVARNVRGHREARGLSLTALAARAGLSKTSLATIEGGSGNPSLDTLTRLAEALNVTLGTLLGEDDDRRPTLLRRDEGETVAFASGLRGRLLRVDGRGRQHETLELRLEAGSRYASGAHAPGTEELVICLRGELRVGPDGAVETLHPGDALHFGADVPHTYESRRGAAFLCLLSTPGVPA